MSKVCDASVTFTIVRRDGHGSQVVRENMTRFKIQESEVGRLQKLGDQFSLALASLRPHARQSPGPLGTHDCHLVIGVAGHKAIRTVCEPDVAADLAEAFWQLGSDMLQAMKSWGKLELDAHGEAPYPAEKFAAHAPKFTP